MNGPGDRALTALCRLRAIETDEARRALAAALAEETALAARDGEITREIAAERPAADIFDREAFSAWLARLSMERARLAEAARAAASRTAAARTALTHRRVAETAANETRARLAAEQEAAAARRDQAMLEDIARALRRERESRGG